MLVNCPASRAQQSAPAPQLSRTIRSWEFLPVVGKRASLFGNEAGRLEAWVYPLKIFRDLHLTFHVDDRALPAETLARTLTVQPESASILYAGDSFRVIETICVPVDEPGAVIVLDIETEQPLEVEAAFTADFQLEWPAALGGTYIDFDPKEHAFFFGEEARKYVALFGSPTAGNPHVSYQTNYSSSGENSIRLGITEKSRETKVLILSSSVMGRADAEKTYQHLLVSYSDLIRQSADYYRDYLNNKTVSIELPDKTLQEAYDWGRVSTIQGLVENPYLGTGLVAGYRTSGVSQRPGFAWFFGRDSFWTSFALNAEGDYSTSRTAIDFVSKFQREDGKIPHEISQSASLVPWFKDFPYPYASADATPLFIIAMDDYARQSGDLAFVRQKWDNLWRAYQFLCSTYDSQGFAQNAGVGHGWVEGGPLLPIKNEYYQAGLAVEALRALADLGRLIDKNDVGQLATEFENKKTALDNAFWSPQANIYAFALKQDNQRAEEASVLATVSMWFGLPDPAHANLMITRLAEADHETDWGMRIISSQSKVYGGAGYHFGSVWPLFTGWAAVGEYRYHRPLPAYFNLRANALLGLDGALGHFSEVLSGDYYDSLSTSSPHQIWSAAMVISPILRGMFGLEADAQKHEIMLNPHLPADWTSLAVRNVKIGDVAVDFRYHKSADSMTLDATRHGSGKCWVEFSPSFSLRAQFISAEMNGRPLHFTTQRNIDDQHLSVRFPVSGDVTTVVIRVKNDVGFSLENELPPLGSASRGLRLIDESWNSARDQLELTASGVAGKQYEISVWNAAQIASVTGGVLTKSGKLQIQIPDGEEGGYSHAKVTIRFARP